MLLRSSRKLTRSLDAAERLDGTGTYHTHVLRPFLKRLRRHRQVHLLDLGPVSGPNLEYFGGQGFRVFAEDLLNQLRPAPPAPVRRRAHRRTARPIEMLAIQPFPHADDQFHGVLCWDVFDFLDRDEATLLAREVHRVLAPGGFALSFFNARKEENPEPLYRYRIVDPDTVEYTRTANRRRIRHIYHNRDIMQVFDRFRVEGFYTLRNRVRELLAEKPARPESPPAPEPAPAPAG